MRHHVVSLSLLLGLGIIGCGETRSAVSSRELIARRRDNDRRDEADGMEMLLGVVACVKSEHDAYEAGLRREPPTLEILVVSGGGDLGAFGAGFLRGWGRVSGPMARPTFTVVTGVSTGALIAPFAFLGDEASFELIEGLYRDPKPDWVEQRFPVWFLPYHASFATVPGLEREVRERMGLSRIARIAEAGKGGRALVLNTTDLDDGKPRVFDLVAEADRAVRTGDIGRVHQIMLASAGIPGAFPHRMIDGSMYVDGGVTGNILYGGRLREAQTIPALWRERYPGVPLPRTRFWIIFNNQFRGPPQLTEPRWAPIFTRSIDLAVRSATMMGIRHLFALAEVARLKHGAPTEIRVVAIPDDWKPPRPGTFVKETMNDLADLGERMGADPGSWSSEVPQ